MSQANLSAIIEKYQDVAPKSVLNAVKKASEETGVNFTYLMEKAAAESSFDAKASSKTSSATGLYQFIEQTWLHMVKDHGDKYGLKNFADQISVNKQGKAIVSNPKVKEEILELRNDPKASAFMAAEFTAGNQNRMERDLNGKEIGATELYFAHFMGAGGAVKFFKELENNPQQPASALFPQAARANKNVFIDQESGKERSLEQVYAFFDKKFQPATNIQTPGLPNVPDVTITHDTDYAVASTVTQGYTPTPSLGQSFVMAQSNMSHIQSPVMVMLMDQIHDTMMDQALSDSDTTSQSDDDQNGDSSFVEENFTWLA